MIYSLYCYQDSATRQVDISIKLSMTETSITISLSNGGLVHQATNSLAPSDGYMRPMFRSTMLKEMAWRPVGANPFPKPKLTTCH